MHRQARQRGHARRCSRRYRTAADYAGADRDDVETLIKPTGFFRNKTTSIIKLGQALVERYDGEVPNTLAELVTLPGFGRKTANVVLGNAFDVPGLTVDTHFGRLVRRWRWTAETDPVKVERVVAELIPKSEWTIFSHRAIWHGRRMCHARKPACGACPIARLCPSFGEGPTDPETAAKLVKSEKQMVEHVSDLPDWLRPLADKARDIDGSDLSRFLPPDDGSGRASAVLMAFADTDRGPAVLLIERAADMRKHAGQVAFPGGSLDPTDESLAAAALREAHEEVGLDPASVRVVADLPAIFIPVSGFVVTPVLAWWEHPHEVRPVDAAEVARVALVPGRRARRPGQPLPGRPTRRAGSAPASRPCGLFVWGFTAGLLDRLLEFGGWARPWDRDVLRPLPPLLAGR